MYKYYNSLSLICLRYSVTPEYYSLFMSIYVDIFIYLYINIYIFIYLCRYSLFMSIYYRYDFYLVCPSLGE